MMKKVIFFSVCLTLLVSAAAQAYPVDGYALTGIRRLARLQRIIEGKTKGTPPAPGALLGASDIRLNLTDVNFDGPDGLPPVDPELQSRIDALFPDRHESYALAILDITPGRPARLAKHQADRRFSAGSVGKLAIAAGLFTELARLYPDATEKRRDLLKNRMVAAGKWIHADHHELPVYDPATGAFAARPAREGDVFSLYEWTDHMLSASANAAASTVWKELVLMRRFGADYPPAPDAEKAFFEKTPKKELTALAMPAVNDPLRALGLSAAEFQVGSLFTSAGKQMIPGVGNSGGTPVGLLKLLAAMEQGRIVDEWSSLEMKRLLYMTARRIRYASSPALNGAAVYFKSGSLYRCRAEAGFTCGKYMGNAENVMNSVAIVEHPDGRTYLTVLMSNVPRKNSAVEHQTLATYIDRILAK